MLTATRIIPRPPAISKYFNAIAVLLCESFATQRYCSDFAETVCGFNLADAKNRRNTCPKISSSASNATASEKTIPPTTAMNVITICMMSSSASYKGRTRAKRYPTENNTVRDLEGVQGRPHWVAADTVSAAKSQKSHRGDPRPSTVRRAKLDRLALQTGHETPSLRLTSRSSARYLRAL